MRKFGDTNAISVTFHLITLMLFKITRKDKHKDEKGVKVVPITCEECDKQRPYENCPKKRNNKHYGIKPENQDKEGEYKCDVDGCSVATQVLQNLEKHKKIVHLGILNYRCSYCDYKAYRKDAVQTHCKSHKKQLAVPLMIPCNLCIEGLECDHKKRRKRSKKKQNMNFDARPEKRPYNRSVEKDQGETYICKICDFLPPFDTVKSRRSHYMKIHPDQFIYNCTKCSYGCNYYTNLKVHINTKHEKINLKCDHCDYNTLWKSVLMRHLREQHGMVVYESKNISKEPILCAECGYSCFSKLRFQKHKCNSNKPNGIRPIIYKLNKIQRKKDQCKADLQSSSKRGE